MSKLHRSTIGKIGECLVLAKMLEHGLEVYQATDDVRGIDFVARDPGGSFVEIQVKTIASDTDPEWFHLETKEDIKVLRKRPYFVVGVTLATEFWVFPPEVFFTRTFASISTSKKGVTSVDMDLAVTKNGADGPNRDRLNHLQDNWALIAERSRSPSSRIEF